MISKPVLIFIGFLFPIDLLKKSAPSRIINVSSALYWLTTSHLSSADIESYTLGRTYHSHSYGISKLLQVIFTKVLAKKLADSGILYCPTHVLVSGEGWKLI